MSAAGSTTRRLPVSSERRRLKTDQKEFILSRVLRFSLINNCFQFSHESGAPRGADLMRRCTPPVITENSVRMLTSILMPRESQISSITLVSLLASLSESKDWQCLPRSVDECIEVQGVRVAKESRFGSAKVWSRKADVDEAACSR